MSFGEPLDGSTVPGSAGENQGAIRTKSIRSKTSCIKCRSRKSRCGALPPETCPYCKKHGLVCVWPEVDGRKTRPRQGQAPAAPFTSFNPSEPLSLHNAIGLQPSTDNEGSAAAWLNLIFSNEVNRVEHPASTAHAGFETLLASSSVENDPHSTAPLDNGVGTTGEGFGTSFGLPQNSLHDVTGVDPASFFREFFDRDFGDVQMQISAENGPTPHTSGDGAISIKVSRAHGRTAFVPGRIKVPFKIQVQPRPSPSSPVASILSDRQDVYSNPNILRHLLKVFKDIFWAQMPCVDCPELEEAIERDPSPSFLMNCVAAISARFSNDPRIAQSRSEPSTFGDVYYERAHAMLGNVVKIPLRETVVGFTLLAYCADSATGTWTMAGMATRMAIDLGLHRRDHSSTPPDVARQNRLCFWSLLVLDTIVSFGVGRETSFQPEAITQLVPSGEDMGSYASRPPFIYAAEMMWSYGTLNNLLNTEVDTGLSVELIRAERAKIMRRYHELPIDMVWSTENLKLHNEAGQAQMFLHLHLWFHTVLSSSMIVADDLPEGHELGAMAGVLTPSDKLSRSGAKMMTEYLTLCDVLNPDIYYTQRFLGQPLFTAARVILQELHGHIGPVKPNGELATERNLTTSLLSSMADGQIDIIRNVMTKTGSFWRGAAVVKEAIEHLVQGRREEDQIWGEDETYAIEMYAWSLPGKYRVNGAQVN